MTPPNGINDGSTVYNHWHQTPKFLPYLLKSNITNQHWYTISAPHYCIGDNRLIPLKIGHSLSTASKTIIYLPEKKRITAIPKTLFKSTDFNKHKLDSSLTQTTRIGVFLPVNVHVYTYLHYNHLRDYIYRQNPIFLLQYMHFFFHCSVT